MKQERWNVERYQAPYLDVHAIRSTGDGVEVEAAQGVFRLSCEDPSAAGDVLVPVLAGLRDPGNALWRSVRGGVDGEPMRAFLRELDQLGLIRDSALPDMAESQACVEQAVRAWSDDLGREIAGGGEDAVRTVGDLAERLACSAEEAPGDVLDQPSFPVLTLLLEARFLRGHAPAALGLLVAGLRAAVRRSGAAQATSGGLAMPSWAEEDWSSGLADPGVVRRSLAVARHLLRQVWSSHAPRRLRPRAEAAGPVSGINFIIAQEGEVARLLAELGTSPVVRAIEEGPLARQVVRAAFLQEYFVTCRFVDCIAPLLARQFSPPLCEAVHRYFAEELGHEKFERENCLRLGMTEAQIDAAEPLPLHVAFVDVLTNAAQESPLSFFCASMFTEGIIGSRHSLVSLAQRAMPDEPALIAAIGDHVAVNDDADHRGVGRDWMSHVPVVQPRKQQELREWVAYLAELNWRMWDDLVRSCALPA